MRHGGDAIASPQAQIFVEKVGGLMHARRKAGIGLLAARPILVVEDEERLARRGLGVQRQHIADVAVGHLAPLLGHAIFDMRALQIGLGLRIRLLGHDDCPQ